MDEARSVSTSCICSHEIPSWSFCRCSRGGQLGHWRDPRVRQPIDQIGHTAHAELEHALLT
jgi:hypothetical protein